jgi:UDP-glucose 6-dehydrogenase
MAGKAQTKTIRRSFALSRKLIDEALMVSAGTEKVNLNKLVTIALQEYINSKKRREFEKSMALMGSDPEILRECAAIADEFAQAENDGLSKEQ